MNKDLTVGRPETVLWRFCLPLAGSVIFQQLYSIADSLVAGKLLGESALAAVGNSYEITLIYLAVAFGCNMGSSVTVSRFFGAKEYSNMKTAIYTAMISSAVVCAVLVALGLLGGQWLLELINTPVELFADSSAYLYIYTLGLPLVFFYNIATGVFSALGDSKTPFIFLACSSVANIFMDILFITRFDMGVAGLAWATFLCQGISCLLSLIFVFRRLRKMELPERPQIFSVSILKMFIKVAMPSVFQQSFISVGTVVIQSVINSFGPGVMAGYAAAVKLNNLVVISYSTLGSGVTNYTSQNMGAKKYDRVRAGFWASAKLVWALTLPVFLIYFFAGKWLVYLFIDEPTALAIQTGVNFLRIISPFYFVVAIKGTTEGLLRGCWMMKRILLSTVTDLVVRVAFAFALAKTALGATGVWCAWPIGWCIATCLPLAFYFTRKWEDTGKSVLSK